jgi:hypothetical protein
LENGMMDSNTAQTPFGEAADADMARRCDSMVRTLQWLLDEVVAETMVATEEQSPGLDRLWNGIQANLDACLRRPAIRVLASALHGHEGGQRVKRRFINGLAMTLQVELNTLGITDAAAHARVLNAMVMEAQRAETEARHALPEYRDSLRRHVYALSC